MKPAGILVAVIPTVGGAVAWGLIYLHTFCEFSFLAWAVGAVIGITAAGFGSRGFGTAVVCAAFALTSIAGGKVYAMQWSAAEAFAYHYLEGWLSFDSYKGYASDAIAFAKVESEERYPQFMAERQYSDAVAAAEVSEAEIDEFVEYDVPWLEWMYEERPTYAEWRAEVESSYAEDAESLAFEEAAKMTLVESVGYVKDYLVELTDAWLAMIAVGAAGFFGYGCLIGPRRT